MVTRIGGMRRKTRQIMRKDKRERGKVSLRAYLQEFATGDRVLLQVEPAIQAGQYFRRFHGKSGIVERKLGTCYDVAIADGGKKKHAIVHPVHLKKV